MILCSLYSQKVTGRACHDPHRWQNAHGNYRAQELQDFRWACPVAQALITQSCFAWKRTAAGWTLLVDCRSLLVTGFPAEAANAQLNGKGIGAGKRVKQHKSKGEGPVCMGGKTLTTCFPCLGWFVDVSGLCTFPPEHGDAAVQLPCAACTGQGRLLPSCLKGNPWDPSLGIASCSVWEISTAMVPLWHSHKHTAELKTKGTAPCFHLDKNISKYFHVWPLYLYYAKSWEYTFIYSIYTIPRIAVLFQVQGLTYACYNLI